MSVWNDTKLTVCSPIASWRSSTGPCCSTCAALSRETFGMTVSFWLECGEATAGPGGAHGANASSFVRLVVLGQQAVLHREQARDGARGRADLRVDVLDVV